MKYIPGMHLRVSEDAETKGLDHDQFCDEEIGDWSFFHETALTLTRGMRKDGVAMSSETRMDRDGAPSAKRE